MSNILDVRKLFNSTKGISGTGTVLSRSMERLSEGIRTLEPGDLIKLGSSTVSAAPIAYDLWYLHCHKNFLSNYFSGIDGDHFDYTEYLSDNLNFLEILVGLKPIKALRDLAAHLVGKPIDYDWHIGRDIGGDWVNNGIYWINLMAFELVTSGVSITYSSNRLSHLDMASHIGYITFPVGQLGVMEVISAFTETDLAGYKLSEQIKPELSPKSTEVPTTQSPPEMFPTIDTRSNACYGNHFIEKAYLVPESTKLDVEYFASQIPPEVYGESVKPKKWLRYWLPREIKIIPGEFFGILVKPITVPPHVWWFQESSPLVYAGNWVETRYLTTGVVTRVILEEDRTDSKFGNQYYIKVQGCEIIVEATDFLLYAVDDRVAVIKITSLQLPNNKPYTWLDQPTLKEADKSQEKINYIIMPATFYKGS